MERKDAASAHDGGCVDQSLKDAITAQHAIIACAIRLINQHQKHMQTNVKPGPDNTGWVYNMTELEKWVHLYTERRKIICPKCKKEKMFLCNECGFETEYHDEL